MAEKQNSKTSRKQTAIELTSLLVHRYYCENDIRPIIDLADEDILWLGAGEQEYAAGREIVTGIFRQFAGQVPKCNISGEEYQAIMLAPDACLCTGRMWIATDASTQISLRVHQRITTAFRWRDGQPRCCHIHISNPYSEMAEDDVGFPAKMAQQSYQYLQERVKAQQEQILAQTVILQRLSYEDGLTGLYNRNRFKELFTSEQDEPRAWLGVAYFDLNGLKRINDHLGHSAGDTLLQQAADQIRQFFYEDAYRIGGDEFVVITDTMNQADFQDTVRRVREGMNQQGIYCSVGVSWRDSGCSVKEQFEEADRLMYQDKQRFYSDQAHDRRKGR